MITEFLPENLTIFAAVTLVIASFFTSALTAAAGIGGGLLMLALMTYFIPVYALIAVHGFVQLGSNAGRSWVQRAHIDWPTARIFLLGSLVGAIVGALIAVQLSQSLLQMLLGFFILFLVWVKLPPLRKTGATLIGSGGAITTFISMFAGATGPLVAVFLNKLFSEHKTLVATHGITMTAQHGFKVMAFGLFGFAFLPWLPLIALMVVSGYLGTHAGTALMNRLPEKILKQIFKAALTLVALDLLRRGFGLF